MDQGSDDRQVDGLVEVVVLVSCRGLISLCPAKNGKVDRAETSEVPTVHPTVQSDDTVRLRSALLKIILM